MPEKRRASPFAGTGGFLAGTIHERRRRRILRSSPRKVRKTPHLLRFIGDSSPYAFLRHVRCKGSAREHRNEEVKIRPRTGTKSKHIARSRKSEPRKERIDEHERDGCRWCPRTDAGWACGRG